MKNFIKITWIAIIAATIVSAENADSIRAEIERLTTQLQQAEQTKTEPQPENIEEAVVIENTEAEEEQKQKTDSVQTTEDSTKNYENNYKYSSSKKDVSVDVKKDDSTLTIIKIKTDKNDSTHTTDTTIKTIRIIPKFFDGDWHKGSIIGMGGGLALGGIYMDMKPIKNLFREKELNIPANFSSREPMFMIGGFGFGGFIDGVRVGGGGYSANMEFRSEKKGETLIMETGTVKEITLPDTTIIADVGIAYGGFIIGRAWVKNKHSFHFQTLIGAGSQDITIEKRASSGTFSNDDDDDDKFGEPREYESKFFACDLQFGYTKSIMPWFHIGAEVSGLIMYSRRGFTYDSYGSINPSAKVRFVFGSLR